MKVYKQKDKIIFEIPFWSKRFNPYMPDEDVGEYKTLTPLIVRNKDGNDEMGWALTIDMDYKGKMDQFTEIMIKWFGEEKEFIKINEELGLDIVEIYGG